MGNLFGSSKKPAAAGPAKPPVLEKDEAILKLKNQRDKLKKMQKKISIQLEKETAVAKELYRKKKKEEAKAVLRKKKFQENLMASTEAQITNLEQLASNIEEAAIQKQVLDGLAAGNAALKEIQNTMSIDDVQDVMDGLKDGLEYANDIQELVGESITQADEEQLEADLLAFFPELSPDGTDIPDAPDTVPTGDKDNKIPDAATGAPVSSKRKPEAVAAT